MKREKLIILYLLFLSINTSIFAQLKPGDISPNAKVIDADELHPFSDGVARIKKGNSWALIDSNGNFIIPYNKWVILEDSKSHFIVAGNTLTNKRFLINTNGNIIVPENVESSFYIDNDGYVFVTDKGLNYFVNAKGSKIIGAKNVNFSSPKYFTNNLARTALAQNVSTNKFKYVDRKLNTIIPGPFDYASPFSEGFAVVGNKNEYGEMKYGFVNTKGELVIPFKFSIVPLDFKSGLALVEAKDNSDFTYAYINRSGSIIAKFKNAPNNSAYRIMTNATGSHDIYHYAKWTDGTLSTAYYIDTLGNFMTSDKFLELFNLPNQHAYFDLHSWTNKITTYSKNGRIGFLDLDTKKVILPNVYYMSYTVFSFDSESNRILTESADNYTTKQKKVIGYINLNGIYVIVKSDETKW